MWDKREGWRFTRGYPLWPAGHLPLKGEITLSRFRLTKKPPGCPGGFDYTTVIAFNSAWT